MDFNFSRMFVFSETTRDLCLLFSMPGMFFLLESHMAHSLITYRSSLN